MAFRASGATQRGDARQSELTEQMLAIPNRIFPRVLLGMAN
jgi:hypothetical protein